MSKRTAGLFVLLSILALEAVAESYPEQLQAAPPQNTVQSSPVVNFFGVIYTLSNTLVRQTQRWKYQSRDALDQLIYDVKVYDLEQRIDKTDTDIDRRIQHVYNYWNNSEK